MVREQHIVEGSGTAVHLALRPKEAAKALGIGERLLWRLTKQGHIPHVRIGRAIVYPVNLLREWLVQRAEGVQDQPLTVD